MPISENQHNEPSDLGDAWRMARLTPWKAVNELKRLGCLPLIRLAFAWNGVRWGSGWRIYGMPIIQRHRASRIVIGSRLEMRSWVSSNPLGLVRPCTLVTWSPGAVLDIGDSVGMSGVAICAQVKVAIGNRVLIGANTVVTDTDFHAIDAGRRSDGFAPGTADPVVIGDDVFIGMHSLILRGSRIGARAVIGAGSVVTGDIPPDVLAAGNPARVIRALDSSLGAMPGAPR